jgi:hypothetical protein
MNYLDINKNNFIEVLNHFIITKDDSEKLILEFDNYNIETINIGI